jgi:type VI secretion system secreted protein VgrG
VVVGQQGDEIFTDKYGRVKVQFPWDREGKKDANSSCWVRVGSVWAGKQWGGIHIPRVGQEVLVAFQEGDPDQPIIMGGVYNAEQMPPYALPDNKTQSGIKTRSTLKGGTDNFNELRFEDKKDSEEIYFHAEKDFNRVVENNDTLKVGSDKAKDGSQTIEVWKDRTETVKTGNELVTISKGNRTVNVDKGNDEHHVKTGNRTVDVDQGNDSHNIKQGNRAVVISMGNDSLAIKMGNQTTKLDMGASNTEAMQSITLKVGQNSITIDQMGVTIKGMMVTVEGQVQTQVKGLMTQVQGSAMTQISGGITMIG